jgi:hypothetical protein
MRQSHLLIVGLPQNDTDFPPPPAANELTVLNCVDGMELRNLCSPAPPSPPRQAKTIVVSSNNAGETSAYYHSFADPDHFPDLLNIPQNRSGCYQGRILSPVKTTTATLSGVKLNQPLNPAALVVPPTPPLQFPHQVNKITLHKYSFIKNGWSSYIQNIILLLCHCQVEVQNKSCHNC